MISANAISSIDWLLEQALRNNIIPGNDGSCVISHLTESAVAVDDTNRHVAVITISSYIFRIVFLFNFQRDAATEAHMALLARTGDKKLSEQALNDAYAELVNMVCGAVNRALSEPFRHVGMSTPFALESSSARYLSILKPSHVLTYEVVVNVEMRFEVIACICCDDESNIDFVVDRTVHEESASGEMELF